jgi:CubicO group peptidase (beta-lactamase class C family)
MTPLVSYAPSLEARLDEVLAHGDVPGAAVAVSWGDEAIQAAAGVRNIGTREPATHDTLWQVGSISKIYTATLVMMLAEAGGIDLDAPVSRQLQSGWLTTADPELASAITPRQLLTHASGLDADRYFHSEGEWEAVDRFLQALEDVAHVMEPGAGYSYSNPGFGLLETMVALTAGQAYARVLHDRLLGPIGAELTEVRLERAVSRRLALGHAKGFGGEGYWGPRWRWIDLSPGVGGVAAALTDVLKLARLHLVNKDSLLTKPTRGAMQEPTVSTPVLSRKSAVGRGLGWAVHRWGDLTLVGHDGDTIGQQALLFLAPDRDFAFVAAGNSNRTAPRLLALAEAVIGDLLEAAPRDPPITRETPIECAGRYERLHLAWEVETGAQGLAIRGCPDAVFAPGFDTSSKPLRPLGGHRHAIGDAPDALRLEFLDLERTGRATHLHLNGRAHKLVRAEPT